MSKLRKSRLLVAVTAVVAFLAIQITPASATASADGVNWTQQTPANSNSWNSVTYGDGLFVAVSNTNGGGSNGVMTSPDGITWTAHNADPATNVLWKYVTYSASLDLFVAVGSSSSNTLGNVMTSPDGINWTAREIPTMGALNSVIFASGKFVAISYAGAIYSEDGITWTVSSFTTTASGYLGVAYGGGKFVSLSSNYNFANGSQVMTSTDGITWSESDAGVDKQWISMTYGGGKFVAVALQSATPNDTALVATSTDGLNWTSQTAVTGKFWYSITYGNGIFVAVSSLGSGNQIMVSTDGETWTTRSVPVSKSWTSVAYGNNTFVVIGYGSGLLTNGVLAPPTVSGVAPTSGTTAGGTTITITGTLFAPGATVTIGGAACTDVVVVSATSITCVTPAGTSGAKDVVVTNIDSGTVTSASEFTFSTPTVNPSPELAATGSDATTSLLVGMLAIVVGLVAVGSRRKKFGLLRTSAKHRA